MKTKLFSLYKLFFLILLIVAVKGWGQINYVTWDFTPSITNANYSTNMTNQVAARSSALTNATISNLTLNGGVSGTSGNTLHRTIASSWSTTETTTKFIEFTITLTGTETFKNENLTLKFDAGVNNIGTARRTLQAKYAWGASTTFANAGAALTNLGTSASSRTATLAGPGNTTTTKLTVRFYNYGTDCGSNCGGNLQIYKINLEGPELSVTPTITVSTTPATNPVSVSGLDYIFGNGPSAPKSFTISGSNLNPTSGNNVIYVMPSGSDFEFSQDGGTTYEDFFNFSFTGNSFTKTIPVRLKAGKAVGNYTDDVTIRYYTDYNSPFNIEKTVKVSRTVSAPASPTITLGTFTVTPLTYPLGTGPSASKNAPISASNLTADVTVSVADPLYWEVSKDGTNSWGTSVVYAKDASNTIGSNQKIYVRLKAGLPVNTYSGTLTANSSGATSVTYNLSGEVYKPSITVSNNTFSLFQYAQGQGPSPYQSFTVSGTNLAGDVSLSVTNANWEFSTNQNFTTLITSLPKNTTDNNLSGQPVTVYVRLKAGLLVGDYPGVITLSSNNADNVTKAVNGKVTPPVGFINVRAIIGSNPSIPGDGSNNASTPAGNLNNTYFAQTNVGDTTAPKSYMIENLGGSDFNVNSIQLDGLFPGDFIISDFQVEGTPATFPATIPSHKTATFSISFKPTYYGLRDAIVRINNTSSNIPNFHYNIQGRGNSADIKVSGNSINIPNGNTTISVADNTFIGAINKQSATNISKDFIIKNNGNVDWASTSISFTGTDAELFSYTLTPNSVAASGGTSTLKIIFTPTATTTTGLKNAIISLEGNDFIGGSPYTFAVQAKVLDYVECAPGGLGNLQPIFAQDFESPPLQTPTWSYTNTNGTIAGGDRYADGPNKPMFLDAKSYQISNETGTLLFSAVNTSLYDEIQLSFRLGAFGSDSKEGLDSNNNFTGDYVAVDISPDGGTTWYKQAAVGGFSNARWSFTSGTGIALADYKEFTGTFNVYSLSAPNTGGSQTTRGYSTVKITNLPKVSNLIVKIIAKNNATTETWAIDNVVISGKLPGAAAIKTYTATGWDGNGLWPQPTQKAVINAPLTVPANRSLTACECTVNGGASLTVSGQASAIIESTITNNGTITIESDGNLIQKNDDAVNTGNITLTRNAKMKRLDYTFWGTPVSGQQLNLFSPQTVASRFYSYNEVDDSFTTISPLTQPMVKGQGYVIRAPNNFTTTPQTFLGVFTGSLNNGLVTVEVTKSPDSPLNPTQQPSDTNPVVSRGKNLVGNPYASNLDLNLLTANNSGSDGTSGGVYYFWTNVNKFINNSNTNTGVYGNYEHNNYASYNEVGGVPPDNDPTLEPTGIVKPGQGFLYVAKQGGTVTFKNSMRTNNQNSIFFSNRNAPPERFWLKLTTPIENFSTILIGYIQGASNDFETNYDAEVPVLSSNRFYSVKADKELIIQGRQYPFIDQDIVPIGINHFSTGNYTIGIHKAEGIFENAQNIYLKDKLTGIITNLSEANYTYSATPGASNDRFEIIYKPQTTLSSSANKEQGVSVYRSGENFVVKASNTKISGIEVFDSIGRLIINKKVNAMEAAIHRRDLTNGVFILKISQDDKTTVKKIVN